MDKKMENGNCVDIAVCRDYPGEWTMINDPEH